MKSDPDLRDRFVTDTAAQPDEFDEENAAMEAFVEERSERFVLGSRETVLEELLAHASATGGNGYVCLIGAPGSGKSALLAHLSQHSTLNSQPFSSATSSARVPARLMCAARCGGSAKRSMSVVTSRKTSARDYPKSRATIPRSCKKLVAM